MYSGLEAVVTGMKAGERRVAIVPPEMGFGAKGRGPVPANATLILEVRLIAIH